MDTTCRGNVGVQMDGDGNLSFPSSIAMPSATSVEALMISKASVAPHPIFSAGWDSLVQFGHHERMGSQIEPFGPNHLPAGNQVTRGSDSFPFPGQSATDPGLAYFGSGNLSEAVVGSLSMPEFMGISDSGCLPSFGSYMNDAGGRGEGIRTSECHDSDDDTGRKSPTNGRTRKRSPDPRSSYGPNEVIT
ncbi:hypothetical protein MLD38_012985 [Melastoma candidum]|uniref:Uncharacterized protein n=1 Tax=Melastoma candidum TaxID=119954 RepID=A0ACB9R835_9MYRT|nr:hypothetical protein MLD38_012985 [Melastoma candidum]